VREQVSAFVQASRKLAKRLGWAADEASVDASSCVDRIHAVFQRAQHVFQGLRTARDSGKPFVADWAHLERQSPAQAEIGKLMVRPVGALE
jgi:hypothetical protein